MNISEVRTTWNDINAVIAELYLNARFPVGKLFIRPYIPEMIKANNVHIFIDSAGNITGGQIGIYDPENGLRVKFLNT